MSTTVDNRVVQMQFDNAQFESGIAQSLATLEKLDKALSALDEAGGFGGLTKTLTNISDGLDETFSVKGVMALETFKNVADEVFQFVKNGLKGIMSNYMPVDLIGQAITGGQRRAQNIEQAKFQLEGLGTSWDALAEDINYAVDQTAYGLDAAGKAASQLVASGVQFGKTFGEAGNSPMAKALRGISGVAAMTNSSYDEIAHIFTTIGGNGKMMTKELRMMAYRGLNVAATMANQFNEVLSGNVDTMAKYSDEVIEMIKDLNDGQLISEQFLRDNMQYGIVSSEMFFEAMNAAYGEHATKANETYAGSLDNVKAALSRLGAVYYQGHMDNMIPFFNQLRLAINGVKTSLTPLIEGFLKFEQAGINIASNIFSSGVFNKAIDNITTNLQAVGRQISAAFWLLFKDVDTPQTIFKALASVFDFIGRIKLSESTLNTIGKVALTVFKAFQLLTGAVRAAYYVIEPFIKFIAGLVNGVLGVLADLLGKLSIKVYHFLETIEQNEQLQTFVNVLRLLAEVITGALRNALITVGALFLTFWDSIKRGFSYLNVFNKALGEDFQTILNNLAIRLQVAQKYLTGAFLIGFIVAANAIKYLQGVFANLCTTITSFSWTEFRKNIDGALGSLNTFVSGLISKAPERIQGFLSEIQKFTGGATDGFLLFVDNAVSGISEFLDLISGGKFSEAFEVFKGGVATIGGLILTAIVAPLTLVVGIAATVYSTVKHYIDRIKEEYAKGGIAAVYALFENKIVKIVGNVKDALVAMGPVVWGAVTSAFTSAGEAIGAFFDSISETRLGSFVNSIRTTVGSVVDFITNLFDTIKNSQVLKPFFDDISKGFDEIKAAFAAGGFTGVLDLIKQKFQGIFDSLKDVLTVENLVSALESLKDIILFVAETIGKVLLALFTDDIPSAIGVVQKAFEDAKNAIISFFETIVSHDPSSFIAGVISNLGSMFGIFKKEEAEITRGAAMMDRSMSSGPVGKRKKTYGEGKGKVEKGDATGLGQVGQLSNKLNDIERAGEETTTTLGKAEGIIGSITSTVSNVAAGISELLGSPDFAGKLETALGITALLAIPQIINVFNKGVSGIAHSADKVAGAGKSLILAIAKIPTAITNFLAGLAGAFKAFAMLGGLTKLVGSFALFIAAFAGAIYLLAQIPKEDFERAESTILAATVTMGVVIGAIAVAIALSSKTQGINPAVAELKTGAKGFVQAVGVLIGMAAAAGLLVLAFKALTQIEWNKVDWRPVGFLIATLLFFTMAVGGLSKYAPVLSKGVLTMLVMALSVSLLVNTFKKLCTVIIALNAANYGPQVDKAIETFGIMMVGLAALAAFGAYGGLKTGLGLLAIVVSIELLRRIFESLLTTEFVITKLFNANALSMIGAIVASLIGIMVLVKKLGAKVEGIGLSLLGVTASLFLLTGVVAALAVISKFVSQDDVNKVISMLFVMMMGITGILWATGKAGKVAVGTTFALVAIMAMIGVLSTIGLALSAIASKISWDSIGKAFLLIAEVFVGVIGILVMMQFVKDVKMGPFIGLTMLLLALGYELSVLAKFSWDEMMAGVLSLSGIIVLLMGLMKASQSMNGIAVASLLLLAGLTLAVAYAIYELRAPLQRGVMDDVWGGIIGLVLVVGALALLATAASKIDSSNYAAVVMLFTMTYVVRAIADSLNALRGYDWKDMLVAALGISGVVLALAGIGMIMNNADTSGIIGLVVIAATVGAVGYTLYQLAQFDWQSILAAAGSIAGVALVLSGVAKIMQSADTQGIIGLVVIAGVIGAVGYTLYQLAEYDWKEIGAAGAILAGVILALSIAGRIATAGIIGLVGIAAVIGVVALALLALSAAAEPIANGIDKIVDSLIKLATWFQENTFIGALDAKITEMITNFDVSEALAFLGGLGDQLIGALQEGWNLAIEGLGTLWDWLKSWLFGSGAEGEGGDGTSGVAALVEQIKGWGGDLVNGFVTGWDEAIASIPDIVGKLSSLIFGANGGRGGSGGSGLSGLVEKALTKGSNLVNNFATGMQSKTELDKVTTAVDGLGSTLMGTEGGEEGEGGSGLRGLVSRAKTSGKNFLQGFIDGLNDQGLWGMLKGVVGDIGDIACGVFNIHLHENSPSEWTWESAMNFILGFVFGLQDNESQALDTIATVGDDVSRTMSESIDETAGQEAAQGFIQTIVDAIEGAEPGILNSGEAVMNAIGDYFTNALADLGITLGEEGEGAGFLGIQGLLNGISDPEMLSSILNLADELGYETTQELIQGIVDGEVDVADACQALGITVESELGQAIDTAFTFIKQKAGNHVLGLANIIDGAAGLFNLGKGEDGTYSFQNFFANAKKKVEEQLNNIVGGAGGGGGGGKGKGSGGSSKSAKDAEEAAKRHAKAVEYQNKVIQEFNRYYGDAYAQLGETAAIDAAKEAIHAMAVEYAKAGEDVEVTEEDIEKAFIEMYDNVHKAIDGSIDMFTKFKVESAGSTKNFIENMKSNLDATEEWSEGLERLAARGFAKGLIEELANGGVKTLDKVRMLLKSSVSEMMEANTLWNSKKDAEANAAIKALTAMAYAGQTTQAVLDIASGKLSETVTGITQEILDANEEWIEGMKFMNEADAAFVGKYAEELGGEFKTLFGNIDLNNRQVLEWSEDKIKEFSDTVVDWVDDISELPGTVSTVLGSSKEYDGVEIAFSPMLQTENGPKILSAATVDKYIYGLIEEAGEGWSTEDLLRLDTKGIEVDGVKVNKIIADIGETAKTTGEAMHYLGNDGSIAKNMDKIKAAADKAGMSFDDFCKKITEATKASNGLIGMTKEMSMVVAAEVDKINVTYRELKSDISDVIESQLDLFKKFERKSDITAEEMLANMESQVNGVGDWSQGIVEMYARGFDEGLIEKVRQLGPREYETLAAFLKMSGDQIEQANAYFQAAAQLPTSASQMVADSYLSLATNSLNQMILGFQTGSPQVEAEAQMVISKVAEAAELKIVEVGPEVGKEFDEQFKIAMVNNSATAEAGGTTVAGNVVDTTSTTLDAGMDGAGAAAAAGLGASLEANSALAEAGAVTVATNVLDAFYAVVGQASPWKTMLASGRYANIGLAEGLKEYSNISVDAADATANATLDSFNNAISEFSTVFDDDVDLDPTVHPTLDLTDVEKKASILSSMFGSRTVEMAGKVGNIQSANQRMLSAINGIKPGNNNNMNVGGITINTQPGQDPEEIGRAVSRQIYRQMLSREVARAY